MEAHARENGYEIHRHAGVGSAVSGVKKTEAGWWVDKGNMHEKEKKVGFKTNELPDDFLEEEGRIQDDQELDILGKPVRQAGAGGGGGRDPLVGC
jgi:hypothetical protein